MKINIRKLTGIELLRSAAAFTTGKECHMSLETAYRNEHSLIRTQQFYIELCDIPLFVASQLVRSHVGVQFFMRSNRADRGGKDFRQECEKLYSDIMSDAAMYDVPSMDTMQKLIELPNNYDRYAPTDVSFICNAEMLLNTSHKRLCTKASEETRMLWNQLVVKMKDVDAALASHMVPKCIYRGGICGEPRCCKYYESALGRREMEEYKALFK